MTPPIVNLPDKSLCNKILIGTWLLDTTQKYFVRWCIGTICGASREHGIKQLDVSGDTRGLAVVISTPAGAATALPAWESNSRGYGDTPDLSVRLVQVMVLVYGVDTDVVPRRTADSCYQQIRT